MVRHGHISARSSSRWVIHWCWESGWKSSMTHNTLVWETWLKWLLLCWVKWIYKKRCPRYIVALTLDYNCHLPDFQMLNSICIISGIKTVLFRFFSIWFNHLREKTASQLHHIYQKIMSLLYVVQLKATDMRCNEKVTLMQVTNLSLCAQPKVILREN